MTITKKIVIAPYNPEWPTIFWHEYTLLIATLITWDVAIEHIGSTAVQGLSAKPIIDILIGVHSLADVNAAFITALKNLGYEYVPEYEQEIPERRYFRKDNAEGIRTHQIHVTQKNSPFWQRHIQFRDYLRMHPEAAHEYEILKQQLAMQHTDTQEYARAKNEFIKKIEKKIEQ